jgi:hypothetical protein
MASMSGAIRALGLDPGHVREHGLVAAADVESHARGRDGVLVDDHAADRDRVADVVVGHERRRVRGGSTALDLLQGLGVDRIAEHRDVVDPPHVRPHFGRHPWVDRSVHTVRAGVVARRSSVGIPLVFRGPPAIASLASGSPAGEPA